MKNRGYVSLILVILISFSIWTVIYSITKKNEQLFLLIKQTREDMIGRSAAYECKMRALELLTEDVHAHIEGLSFGKRCTIDSVYTSLCTPITCNSSSYGELKDIYISSGAFKIQTRFMFLNDPPFEIKILKTEKI